MRFLPDDLYDQIGGEIWSITKFHQPKNSKFIIYYKPLLSRISFLRYR